MLNLKINEYFNGQEKFCGNVLISKNNEIIYHQSYGYSSIEKGKKNNLNTKFMVGSITKPITALCIMQLSESGMLSLQQKVEEYIPDFYKGKGIIIHHLLNHTSGLPNFTALKNQIKCDEAYSTQEILEIVKNKKTKFAVGEKWSYCNTNYLILGLIIEQVSGMNYHDYVRDNIFIPAGMDNTTFIGQDQMGTAVNYINGEKGLSINPTRYYACGDIVSTTYDLYMLDIAIRQGKLLKAQTVEEMETPQYDGRYIKYGYGWFIKNHFGCKSVCHGGSIPNGYTSHFERYIDDNITIVVLSNNLVKYSILSTKVGGGTYISREIASIVYGKKLSHLNRLI